MKLLKNKFFVVIVAVAIVLCVLPTALYATGQRDLLHEGVSLIATPFRAVFTWVADGITGFGKYFSSVDALIKENEKLKEELEEYKNSAAEGEIAKGENEWLRDQMGFVDKNVSCQLQDAAIIGYSAGSYSSIYTLNRGSESGIKKNMAVIANGGVVGYVKEVGLGSCKVAGITDVSSAVGVYCARSGVYGKAEGSESYISDGLLVVSGLSKDSNVKIGDLFCTSGYGGIFPPDFPVGKVASISEDEFLRTMTVVLEPTADLDSVTRVFVVLNIEN